MSSGSILFRFHRKNSFRAMIIPYHIFINGQYAGSIKSGGRLEVIVPKSACYLIEEKYPFSFRSILIKCVQDIIDIEIKTHGGWTTPCYAAFYPQTEGTALLPSPFDCIRAVYDRERTANTLSAAEKTLFLLCEFYLSFSDDGHLSEVAVHESAAEILHALRTVGALQLSKFCETCIYEALGNASLPLENIEEYEDRLSLIDEHADHVFKNHSLLAEFINELRLCTARFIIGAQ